MNEHAVRNLAAAVVLRAVKDYFERPTRQKEILKDLRSDWMDTLTNGTSVNVAEQLEKRPAEIVKRMQAHML